MVETNGQVLESSTTAEEEVEEAVIIENTDSIHGFVDAMTFLGLDFRYNVRRHVPEVKRDGVWRSLTDRDMQYLQEELYCKTVTSKGEPYNLSEMRLNRFMGALSVQNECDPFLDWLNELPEWDGEYRLDILLKYCFPQTRSTLADFVGRYLTVACVYRAFHPGFKADIMPILQGPQGLGKSTFIEHLLPLGHGFFKEGLRLTSNDSRHTESILGAVLVEYGELVDIKQTSVSWLKGWITRKNDDNVRLPYATRTEDLPRRCIFVGTTNKDTPLANDPTGNRRFIVIKLRGSAGIGSITQYLAKRREMLWAEALHLYQQGMPIYLTSDEEIKQLDSNESARDRDDDVEDALLQVEWKDKQFRTKDIAVIIGAVANFRRIMPKDVEHRIVRALTVLGFSREGRKWRPPKNLLDSNTVKGKDDEARHSSKKKRPKSTIR